MKRRAEAAESLAAARQGEIERLNADLVIQLERSQRMVSRADYDADLEAIKRHTARRVVREILSIASLIENEEGYVYGESLRGQIRKKYRMEIKVDT